jgi:hypothetical protein
MKLELEDPDLVSVASPGKAGQPPRRLSAIFLELAQEAEDAVTIEQIREALGDRSFATLLVFFALLNLLPLPPGSTLVLGIPLLLIALQMVLGNRTVWLPRFLLAKSVSAERFRHLSEKLVPRLQRLERVVQPRYWPFARGRADRILGALALIMAIAITLPIPFGNWFPALSCVLLGLALSERDGILLTAGVTCSIFSFFIIGMVVGAAGAVTAAILG